VLLILRKVVVLDDPQGQIYKPLYLSLSLDFKPLSLSCPRALTPCPRTLSPCPCPRALSPYIITVFHCRSGDDNGCTSNHVEETVAWTQRRRCVQSLHEPRRQQQQSQMEWTSVLREGDGGPTSQPARQDGKGMFVHQSLWVHLVKHGNKRSTLSDDIYWCFTRNCHSTSCRNNVILIM